jgi:hypothetical protein
MITHINWGGETNPRAIKHQMLERFKYGNKLFGQVKSLDVLWTAKKHGQAEPDTAAFLTYEDRESHWYAIAFITCCLRLMVSSAYLDQQLIPII